MEKAKKRKIPDPGQYDKPHQTYKIRNFALVTGNKNAVVDDSTWYGMQTPGHIYDLNKADKLT